VDNPAAPLVGALTEMRTTVAGAHFPLRVPGASDAGKAAARVTKQLDDYLLPRVTRLDAPLLVVVGGSTGAGKSTLVNSMVRAPVSAASVLRPTTRAPVLVSHPQDAAWFAERNVLPGLTRTNASRDDHASLQVVPAQALTAGLALLDAPDIDSVVDANRELAGQLLAAADLWLFVTTAARYADAVPWRLLRTAHDRGTVLAIVLDRVPSGAEDEVAGHLRQMLEAQDLPDVVMFVLPETQVDGSGLLPEEVVAPLRYWLAQLAGDQVARSAVIRTTLSGAIRGVVRDVDTIALAADEQTGAWISLDQIVDASYSTGEEHVMAVMADGALLRGEVLARWQEFVGTGDLMRALQARIGKIRDSLMNAVTGRPPPGGEFRDALTSGVATLIEATAAEAAERTAAEWRTDPAGAGLLTPGLTRGGPQLTERCERLVRDWQRGVFDLVREQGSQKRKIARITAYTVNATGLLVMIGVFASTAFIPTGAEIAVAGGTGVAAQKLLEAVFGDEAMRQLAKRAREDLLDRVRGLLQVEASRYAQVRTAIALDPQLPERLRRGARAVALAATGDYSPPGGPAPVPPAPEPARPVTAGAPGYGSGPPPTPQINQEITGYDP
jgi:hypothetical protein